MARLPVPGRDDGNWGELLNAYLDVEHNSDGTQKTLAISRGGTGATNAADARSNLGLASHLPTFIQNSKPSGRGPFFWIQTGLGSKGDGMTFWVDDGK